MNNCSIIIPVYNAYECLVPCIDSVIKHTDLENNNLIIIDDCSPDDRVLPLLKEYADCKGVTLLLNEENLGFVKTVNKGMTSAGRNDVLLLNSDTEVTKDWLKKIQKCAYSKERIATVTPLSNNATLASVPEAFKPNTIPDGYDLESFAKLVEECSMHIYPEVPTGHGFCLYIRRDALDSVGLFDQDSFGKGYGEENDFCCRCLDAGYRHILCDDTYILHKESQSFLESKEAAIAYGLRILNERYSYNERLHDWLATDSIRYLGENIKLSMNLVDNTSPNIMVIIHDWESAMAKIGGTSLHVKDIIGGLKDKFNFHVLYPKSGGFELISHWVNTDYESKSFYSCKGKFSLENFFNDDYKRIVENIIEMFGISIVHIHHIKNHYFDIFDVCKEKKVKLIATLHDYYYICPSINKLYLNKEYCGEGESNQCKECMALKYSTQDRAKVFVDAWREVCHNKLKLCDMLIAPSVAAKDEIISLYNDLDITVIEHGIDLQKKPITNHDFSKFNIAFIGGIAIHKGRKILESLIRNHKGIRVHLFGIADKKIFPRIKFYNHGKYKRNDLPELLSKNGIDLVCLFSIWPETYSYTLTEAVACGIPVISFDFGAIAERIKKYNLGYLVKVGATSAEIIETINRIRQNKAEYQGKLKSIEEYRIKSTAEMNEEYDKIYSSFFLKKPYREDAVKQAVVFDKNVDVFEYVDVFSIMNDSIKWRIVSKIRFPKIVGRTIRRILRQ